MGSLRRLSWLTNETQVLFDSIFCCGIKKKQQQQQRNMRFAYSILSEYFKNVTWRLENKIKLY